MNIKKIIREEILKLEEKVISLSKDEMSILHSKGSIDKDGYTIRFDTELDEGFGGEFLSKKERKIFEKERLENAEVLGYTLTGTKDIRESVNETDARNDKSIGTKNYKGVGWFWPSALWKHYLRDTSNRGRKVVHDFWLKAGFKVVTDKRGVPHFNIKPSQKNKAMKIVDAVEKRIPIKESINESKKEKDQIIKYLQVLGFDKRTAKNAVAKSYNYISKAYRNIGTQYKGDLIARILQKNESVFAVNLDKEKNDERHPEQPNINYDPEKGKSRIKKIRENKNLITEATRWLLGVEMPNGQITSTYGHWDGYPSHTGKILKRYYSGGAGKVRDLIKLGKNGISSLEKSMKGGKGHSFNNPLPGETIFYGRDRGDKQRSMRKWRNRDSIKYNSGEEFAYIWSVKDRKWYVNDTDKDEWKVL